MPIFYNQETKKWNLTLTNEEQVHLPLLLKYLQLRINTECVFIDKNNKINTIADLRQYNDEDFFNS